MQKISWQNQLLILQSCNLDTLIKCNHQNSFDHLQSYLVIFQNQFQLLFWLFFNQLNTCQKAVVKKCFWINSKSILLIKIFLDNKWMVFHQIYLEQSQIKLHFPLKLIEGKYLSYLVISHGQFQLLFCQFHQSVKYVE